MTVVTGGGYFSGTLKSGIKIELKENLDLIDGEVLEANCPSFKTLLYLSAPLEFAPDLIGVPAGFKLLQVDGIKTPID
ncbi:MAG: hypothetical protein EOP77_00765 [Variovorax sp.]|nr:MAG: hypothetical protein EOP77_00765 [Variovorax sp.]